MTVLIPWLPEVPAQQVLTYRCTVLQAADGTEHRASLDSRPRERYSAQYILEETEIRELRGHAFARPADLYLVPMRPEGTQLTAAAASTTFAIDPTLIDWAVVGQYVYVEDVAGGYRYGPIASVSVVSSTHWDLTITSAGSTETSFAAFSAHVYPLASMRLRDAQQRGRYAANAGIWQLDGEVEPANVAVGRGATLATFDSIPLLDRLPSANDVVQEQVVAGLDVVDYGGAFETSTLRDHAQIRRSHAWAIATDAQRQWWKLFLATCRGRRGTFLLPTWRDDLVVSVQPTAGAGDLVVTAVGDYAGDWFASPAQKRIQCLNADGSVEYKRVNSVTDGGATQTLHLTTTLSGEEIVRVSFLELARLEQDEITFQHQGWRSTVELAAIVVPQ